MSEPRRPVIAANWKMHHDHLVAIQVVQKLSYRLEKEDYEGVDLVICPPFTDLRTLQTLLEADEIPIALGAQNCYWEDKGAFTGEVSPPMLAKLNVAYVIVGHSERRQLFGETDESVNAKTKAVLAHEMIPIVCVGETLEERERGSTDSRVSDQTRAAFAGVKAAAAERCVVAYEPVWAIGTGLNATPEQAQEVHAAVRGLLREFAGPAAADMRILYGGSVKGSNIDGLMSRPDIDGALVGGASLQLEDFLRIIRFVKP